MFDPTLFRTDLATAMRAAGVGGFKSKLTDALKAVSPPEPRATVGRTWLGQVIRDAVTKRTLLMLVDPASGDGPTVTIKPEYDSEGFMSAFVVMESPETPAAPGKGNA